jgi:hypothetical protein
MSDNLKGTGLRISRQTFLRSSGPPAQHVTLIQRTTTEPFWLEVHTAWLRWKSSNRFYGAIVDWSQTQRSMARAARLETETERPPRDPTRATARRPNPTAQPRKWTSAPQKTTGRTGRSTEQRMAGRLLWISGTQWRVQDFETGYSKRIRAQKKTQLKG